MGPTGAAAERVALSALSRAGVDLSKLKLGQLDMGQQVPLLQKAGKGRPWLGVDALYGFDPFPAAFEEAGLARMLDCGHVVSVVLATAEMVDKRSDELKKFLEAYALGWHYYANHSQQANTWFLQAARIDVSSAALDKSASVEPNVNARTLGDLRFEFNEQDLADLKATAQFLLGRGIIAKPIDPVSFIDTRTVKGVLADSALPDKARRMSAKP
jgi:ABC-type nitrate/sulfonate/bicarbonate transport system substrate-binding protein